MKKSFFIICSVTILSSAITIANAQAGDLGLLGIGSHSTTIASEKTSGYLNNLSVKAVRHFRKTFKETSNESWMVNKDSYRASFYKDSIRYIVDYYKTGNWRNTILIYDEHNLPADLRRSVLTTFFDYHIVTVTELRYGKILAYFIKLEDEKTLKTVRVMNNEMEVVEDYKR